MTTTDIPALIDRARWLANGQDDPHSGTITELCDALETLRASVPDGWRDIASAPKDGSNILIIAGTAYSPEARVGWWDNGWLFYSRPSKPSGGGVTVMIEVTHWQPLPAAPSNDTRGDL